MLSSSAPATTDTQASNETALAAIKTYWNEHIHDLAIATAPIGSRQFFDELDAYRFEKLHYLPRLVDFGGYTGRQLLEIGCGVGIDLARFARGGAHVTGVDLSDVAIGLARQNLDQQDLGADLRVMNGEALQFADRSFDVVYAHGVLQYTADARHMVAEIERVLRPGGTAILMVYNTYSWLKALSWMMRVELEHADAPVLRTYSIRQFRQLLAPFQTVRIVPERFPVPTRLQQGLKALLYNRFFVGAFQVLPQPLVRPLGWHLMACATKNKAL